LDVFHGEQKKLDFLVEFVDDRADKKKKNYQIDAVWIECV